MKQLAKIMGEVIGAFLLIIVAAKLASVIVRGYN